MLAGGWPSRPPAPSASRRHAAASPASRSLRAAGSPARRSLRARGDSQRPASSAARAAAGEAEPRSPPSPGRSPVRQEPRAAAAVAAATHATALCRVLGVAEPRLMALVGRCPALFAFSPEALDLSLTAIAGLTGLQPFQVPQLLAADPHLLTQPDRLKANMRGLAQALAVPGSEVGSLAHREPATLAISGLEAEARLAALGRLLQADPARVTQAVLTSPGLLVAEPAELEGQMQALEDAVAAAAAAAAAHSGPRPSRAAQAAVLRASASPSPAISPAISFITSTTTTTTTTTTTSPGSASATDTGRHRPLTCGPIPCGPSPGSASATDTGTGCGTGPGPLRALLVALVLSKPSLLLATPPDLLAARLRHLAAKTGMRLEQVLAAAPAGPNLLAASSCHIDRHCRALAEALGPAGACAGGEAEAAAMLVAAPQLLGLHVGALAGKWGLLSSICGSHQRWAAALGACAPAARGELLALPYGTVARLRFLADYGLQPEVALLDIVRVSDALFHLQYPAYKGWLRGG